MPINPVIRPPEQSDDSIGVIGSIIGGLAGAALAAGSAVALQPEGVAAAPAVGAGTAGAISAGAGAGAAAATPAAVGGGTALSAGLGGFGAGSALGGMAGRLATDAGLPGGQTAAIPQSDFGKSSPLGTAGHLPEVQMATMQNARNHLQTSNIPGAQDYINTIDQAQAQLKNRMGSANSMGGIYG